MYYPHILLAFVISPQGRTHRLYFPPSESSTETCGADSSFLTCLSNMWWVEVSETSAVCCRRSSRVQIYDMQTVFFMPETLCVNWRPGIMFVWADRWLTVKEAASVPPADRLTGPVCASVPLYKQLSHIIQPSPLSAQVAGQPVFVRSSKNSWRNSQGYWLEGLRNQLK